MLVLAALIAAAYLAGSVNFSVLVLRALGRGDPRERFSGNPGTTNVYRVAGPFWASVVLLLDLGRAGGVAAGAGLVLPAHVVPWVAAGLLAGNRYPLFHRFSGGKGVANYLGFTLALSPATAAVSCAAWVALYAVARHPFVASFLMIAVLAAGTAWHSGFHPGVVVSQLLIAGFVVKNHRENLARLMRDRRENRRRRGESPSSGS